MRQNHKKKRQSGAGRTPGQRSQPHGKATRHVGMPEGTLMVLDTGDTEKGRRERNCMSCREKATQPDSQLQR